jgi:putative hemolysin
VSARPGDLDGLTTLEQFEDLTGYALPEGPYDTLAGFWVARHGDLPEVGATVRAELAKGDAPPAPVDLTIVEMDGRRASRIAVRPVLPSAGPPPPAAAD